MFGFFIGFLCLAGLIAVVRSGRRCGRGWHGRGGCGHHGRHGHSGGGHWGGRGGGPRAWMRWLFERLDTTPGQEKEIAAAVEELVGKARSLKDEGKTTRDDVAKLLRTESLDETVMGELFGRHDDRLREMQKAFADALGRIHQALEPQQREQLALLIESERGAGFGGPYRGWV